MSRRDDLRGRYIFQSRVKIAHKKKLVKRNAMLSQVIWEAKVNAYR